MLKGCHCLIEKLSLVTKTVLNDLNSPIPSHQYFFLSLKILILLDKILNKLFKRTTEINLLYDSGCKI